MGNKNIELDKLTLLEKLELLYELEISKPIEEMDTDFLDEIVLLGLELKEATLPLIITIVIFGRIIR